MGMFDILKKKNEGEEILEPQEPNFDFDMNQMQQDSDDAASTKKWLGVAGNALQGLQSTPSAYELLYNKKIDRPDIKGGFDAIAGSIQDPTARQAKLYQAYKNAKEAQQLQKTSAEDEKLDASDSVYAKAIRERAAKDGFSFDEGMSARDMLKTYDPKKHGEIKAQAAIDDAKMQREHAFKAGQSAKEIAKDLRIKEMEAGQKKKEMNVAQSKQMGLYNLGLEAEKQFQNSVADKSDYDPTSSGQWIDNSAWAPNFLKNDNAIKSQAAQSNWVEAYLRDASGAAIPPSERGAYAVDFFPQPGDPEDVVLNKEKMRAVKMANAALGAGKEVDPDALLAEVKAPAPQTLSAKQISDNKQKALLVLSQRQNGKKTKEASR